jgi:stage II sporulation protein D
MSLNLACRLARIAGYRPTRSGPRSRDLTLPRLFTQLMRYAMRTATIVLAAVGALCLTAAAASASWTVKGHGFGHGVGLSQYGAYGFAENGVGYQKILAHYYSGTDLGRESGRVRVLLGESGSVRFTGASKACGESIGKRSTYSFVAARGGVELRDTRGDRLASCGGEGMASNGIKIAGYGSYRGALVAHEDGGRLLVINALRSEDYIRGVVANESPSSWPADALRAQAVVARTYGLATSRGGTFDHYADTRSQVYGGKKSETKPTNRAVSDTAKQVVTYKGDLAVTYYFSTSGGKTEDSEYGFAGGNSVPYLRSVKDPYDDLSPVHNWTETFSNDEMETKLRGLFSGKLREIDVTKTGSSPRIVKARVIGSSGSTMVTGDVLRARLGLMSTWARFKRR